MLAEHRATLFVPGPSYSPPLAPPPPSIPPRSVIKVARQWRRARERSRGKRGLFSAMEKFFSRDKHSRSADPRRGRGRNSKPEADLDEQNLERMKRKERKAYRTFIIKVGYIIV